MTSLAKTIQGVILAVALGGAGFFVSTITASAADAEAKVATNIRSGPGPNYKVLDTLEPGEDVDIRKCTPSGRWCYITHSGPDGWVYTPLLRPVGGASSGSGITSNNCTFSIGPSGFRFSCRSGSVTVPAPMPVVPGPNKRVCFYDGANYTGNRMCVNDGVDDPYLSGYWNNRISSLKVYGGANATLCQNVNYSGFCNTFGANVPHLGYALNNKASSYKTW